MCVCVSFGRLGLKLNVFYLFPYLFPDRVPHWIYSSPICVKWLANQFQGLACHCVPSSWIVSVQKHAQLLHQGWGSEFGSSCLHSKHFTVGSSSPVPMYIYFTIFLGSNISCRAAGTYVSEPLYSCSWALAGDVGQPLHICLSWSSIGPVWTQKVTNKLGSYSLRKFPHNDASLRGG